MKEIISTVAKALDATAPTETSLVLFKDFRTSYNADNQSETFNFNSYKVIDDEAGEYQLVRNHKRTLDKDTLDALRASLTIISTDYTDVRNEEILKGVQKVVNDEGIFGLTSAQLTLR
jgi:hypothetical protein